GQDAGRYCPAAMELQQPVASVPDALFRLELAEPVVHAQLQPKMVGDRGGQLRDAHPRPPTGAAGAGIFLAPDPGRVQVEAVEDVREALAATEALLQFGDFAEIIAAEGEQSGA